MLPTIPLYTPSRHVIDSLGLSWGWPGFYAEWHCQAKNLSLCLDNGGRDTLLLIDGKPALPMPAAQGLKRYEMSLDSSKPHTLRLQDLCAEWHGEATLYSLESDGIWLPPPPPRPLLFEFIGDSWTAGWGNLSQNQLLSDCTQSYAALLADMCQADYSLIAAAGQGIAKNYGEEPGTSINLCERSRRTLPNEPSCWVPKRQADWVFVLAGENDYSQKPWPDSNYYTKNLRGILADARIRHPGARIALICVDRPHPNPGRIRAVHAEEKAEGLDTLLLECPDFSPGTPLGYLWHPGQEHHRELARQLATQLEGLI